VQRPVRDNKTNYEARPPNGPAWSFATGTKTLSGFNLQCLPLVPVFEAFDRQSDHVRGVINGWLDSAQRQFPRGFSRDIRFVLDGSRIDSSVDLSAANNPANIAWDGAWVAGQVDASRQRRRCELLEKTFIVNPQINPRNRFINNVNNAHWDFDTITLADFGWINIPAPPPNNSAVVANRQLLSFLVPVLAPVMPRLLALTDRHAFLAPGHGLYDNAQGSGDTTAADLAHWTSPRGGWNLGAGEDHNDGLLGMEVARIARANGMTVTSVREDQDLTRPGVSHPADNTFRQTANLSFPRLWQLNPVYYLGALGNGVVIGTNLGRIARNHNSDGIRARREYAQQVAGGANPIEIILAIHTNAGGAASRGVTAIWLDVRLTHNNNNEFNTPGRDLATLLRDQLVSHAHMIQRNVLSLRQLNQPRPTADREGISDLQDTLDHWEERAAGSTSMWTRARQQPPAAVVANWRHRAFPIMIPVAVAEAGFHSNTHDAALLKSGWWRRLAAEAMAFALEASLRQCPDPNAADRRAGGNIVGPAHPASLTESKTRDLLAAAFGSTARIGGLGAGNAAIGAAQAANAIRTATGEVTNPATDRLDDVVTAIEQARDRYHRRTFVTGLRDALAHVAGYPAGDPGIDSMITAGILSGSTLLSRPDNPIIRSEAGAFVATALGWPPAALDTTINRGIMQLQGGRQEAEKYVPRVEADDILTRVRALPATNIWRITGLYLADENGNRLQPLPGTGGTVRHALRAARLSLVAETAGVPWSCPTANLVFAVSDSAGSDQTLTAQTLSRQRVVSTVWDFRPTKTQPRTWTITFTARHARDGEQTLKRQTIEILVVL
jgi:hypothetical protein